VGFRLDDTGTGDEKKLAFADMDGTDFKGMSHAADFILLGRGRMRPRVMRIIFRRRFTDDGCNGTID
jgi:hypothetical protein